MASWLIASVANNKGVAYQRAVDLTIKLGEDSLAYLNLEGDKSYYFGCQVEGFIAYITVGRVAVAVGNPVCDPDGMARLFSEFRIFCRHRRLKMCFCSISREFGDLLIKNGFLLSKYGEEAILDLKSYEMTGKKTLKLRQKLRRAEGCGMWVMEYKPNEKRDLILEQQLLAVSKQWLANKPGKLTFSLGDLNLEVPLHRRYYACMDPDGKVQAVLTFLPFARGRGYYLDVMRRIENAVPGVMEKAIIDAAMMMKDEGVELLSLGLAPLAGIDLEENRVNLLERGMHLVYNRMNQGYKFRTLYDYKRKFGPTYWRPRYVAHEEGISLLRVGYVMIKARSGSSTLKQLTGQLLRTRRPDSLSRLPWVGKTASAKA